MTFRNLNFKFVVAFVAFTATGSTAAQDRLTLQLPGSDSSDPTSTVLFFGDGRIRGWEFGVDDHRTIEIIDDADRRLLALEIRLDGRDMTDEVAWQTTSNAAEQVIEFVGRHRPSGLRILRTYASGTEKPALLATITFEFENAINEGLVEATLIVPHALRTHISNDNSLGDYFYGHKRTYFSEGSNIDQLYVGDDEALANSIAFSSRHIGLRVKLLNPSSNQKFHVSPSAPAMIGLGIPSGPTTDLSSADYSIDLELAARPLLSSLVSNTDFEIMLYTDMWAPLRTLAQFIERIIQGLYSVLGSLGVAVIAFALLLRLVLLPISLWSIRQQRSFSVVQEMMAPKIKEINATFKGAEKSERTLELYKEYKISPFTGLKGSAALFVQLPILIAFFATTTESALFRDIPFLWFTDLSLPDRTFPMPFTIPGIGNYVNLMPIILGLVSVLASTIQQHSAVDSASKISRGAIIMVLLIVIFFYSFAAALVLYWTVVNIAQILEGQFVHLRENVTKRIFNDS